MDNLFKQLKKQYRETKIPKKLETSGWQDLLSRLEDEETVKPKYFPLPIPRFAYISLALFFVFATGTYGIYQAARKSLPGQALYPVRKTAERIAGAVSGDKQIIINEQAKDIIESTKSATPKNLDKTLEEYNKSLENLKKQKEMINEENKKIDETLEKHEREFRKLNISTSSAQMFDRAMENIKAIRKEFSDDKNVDKKENNNEDKSDIKVMPEELKIH